jgi:ABC-type multidrug transport system fused ATPase/permease subunit
MSKPSRSLSLVTLGREISSLLSADQRLKVTGHVIFSILQALAEVVSLALVLPLFYQLVSNSQGSVAFGFLTGDYTLQYWPVIVALVVGMFLIKNITGIWLVQRQLNFLNGLYLSLSERIYRNFFSLDWTTYSKANSAEEFRKIKNTAFDFTSQVLGNVYLLITDLAICILMTGVLLWIDYRTIVAMVILLLPMALFYVLVRKRIVSRIDRSFRTLTPQASVVLSQGIESFAETRLYKKENYFIKRFMEISEITTSQLASLKVYSFYPTKLMEVLGIVLFSGVVAYTKLFPGQEQSLLVMLGLLSLVLYRVVPSVNRAIQSLSQIQAYSYSVAELTEALAPSNWKVESPLPLEFNGEIKLERISFSYTGDNFILKDASASIQKGDFLVLEGISGSGKSTLLHVLAGLINNYTGVMKVDAQPMSSAYKNAWQEKLSIVQQSPVVLQDTILRNICFGEDENEMDRSRIAHVLMLVGLDVFVKALPQQLETSIGEHGLTLSGGQRQRLCLARALYRDPEVLLLDEVTNQLDEESKGHILRMLQQLCRQGKTVILSSHDGMVKQFSSRILRLEGGALTEPVHQI